MESLHEQCTEMGVTFRYEQGIRRIEKSMRGQLQAVDINSSKPGNTKEVNLACHNIIVAAGAQTLDALDDIVTWLEPKTTFENYKQSYEWARAPLGDASEGADLEDVSVVIRGDNLTHTGKGKGRTSEISSSPSFSSFSILTAEPKTNTILAATIGKRTPTQHFTDVPGVNMEAVRVHDFNEAEKLARTYIQGGKTAIPTAASAATAKNKQDKTKEAKESANESDADEMEVETPPKTTGSGTISTAFGHRPLIDMIPWHVVDPRTKETVREDKVRLLGIFVAYGCGRHGTTLAPGVARIVVSKIFGDKDAAVAGVGDRFAWPQGFYGEEMSE